MRSISSLKAGFVALALAAAAGAASGAETTVQNDSVTDGASATICPCFGAGEHAAVWLTSPCNGAIVAIQVFWRSPLANSPDIIEDSILIRNPGNYPTPGTVLETLQAPVLTDGVLNEYRFLDENLTIPINVPVTAGQEFVIDFVFFNNSKGHFIKFLCNSSRFKENCGIEMKKGAGVANLNVADLEKYKVPLPPLPEQTQIVLN